MKAIALIILVFAISVLITPTVYAQDSELVFHMRPAETDRSYTLPVIATPQKGKLRLDFSNLHPALFDYGVYVIKLKTGEETIATANFNPNIEILYRPYKWINLEPGDYENVKLVIEKLYAVNGLKEVSSINTIDFTIEKPFSLFSFFGSWFTGLFTLFQ